MMEEKIAKILRVDHDVIKNLEKKAEFLTGKKNVMDKIVEMNKSAVKNRLQIKEIEKTISAEEVYDALVNKIKEDDLELFKALNKPSFLIPEDIDLVLSKIRELLPAFKGFFLKKDKAVELLRRQPPLKVISYLNYKSVDELIDREDVFEIFAALRLFEDNAWMNNVFAKEFLTLTPDDFEKREIVMKSLGPKWIGTTQAFLKSKHQNISHLKELGQIFVVPIGSGSVGEIIRMFSLALHYFYEVQFYSELFEDFSKDPSTFAKNLVSSIKIDIIDQRLSESERMQWLVLPRYLAKYDENDWRLFEPHISPEALFWKKAENALLGINNILKDVYVDFSFWQDLDWVGDYFKTSTGIDVLVSFNLVDTSMSLLKERELTKYLYHHQEALWNKIFTEYFGEEKLEQLIKENITRGWFEL